MGQLRPNLGRIRPNSANFGARVDQICTACGRKWDKLGAIRQRWLEWANLGPISIEIGPMLTKSGGNSSGFGQTRLESVKLGPILTENGPPSIKSAENSTGSCPKFVKFAIAWARFSQCRPSLPRSRPTRDDVAPSIRGHPWRRNETCPGRHMYSPTSRGRWGSTCLGFGLSVRSRSGAFQRASLPRYRTPWIAPLRIEDIKGRGAWQPRWRTKHGDGPTAMRSKGVSRGVLLRRFRRDPELQLRARAGCVARNACEFRASTPAKTLVRGVSWRWALRGSTMALAGVASNSRRLARGWCAGWMVGTSGSPSELP